MYNSVKFSSKAQKVTMIHFNQNNFVFSTIKKQLRLLDYFFKIFGLASLDLPTPFFVGNFIYPLFIVAGLLYASVHSLKQFHEGEYTIVSPVTLIANHLQLLSLSMASCVSVTCSIIRYRKYDSAIEELIQIDNIMIHKLSIDVTKDNLHANKYLFASFLVSFLLIAVDYILLIHNGPKYYLYYVITFHMSFLMILLADCRILVIFKLLTNRFEYINGFLKISKQDKNENLQIVNTIKYYSFTKRKVKELANVYTWLIKTTENLNSYFSPSLLVEIAAYFTIATCNIYTFFYVLTDPNLKNYHRMIVYYTAYWPVVIVLKLCFLLKSSGNVTDQTNLTSNLVHKILINGEFPEVHKELDIFALQLMYKKLQINVCGFFPLDFSLLYAMISASTTYLIILIQFQISTEN